MMPVPTVHCPDPGGFERPPRLEAHQKMQLRAAAHRAKQLYPGPVGQLISDELHAVDEFGYVFLNGGRTAQLLAHVLTTPLPAPTVEV